MKSECSSVPRASKKSGRPKAAAGVRSIRVERGGPDAIFLGLDSPVERPLGRSGDALEAADRGPSYSSGFGVDSSIFFSSPILTVPLPKKPSSIFQ